MKKHLTLAMTFFVACGLAFAKPAQAEEPDWVSSWRAIYPDSTYVAQLGKATGKKNAARAKTVAANTVAQYIRTKVQSELSSSEEYETKISGNGKVSTTTKKTSSQDITLQVDLALTSLEFTDPWYSREEKTWYCVAYASRQKLYEAYKPQVQSERNAFYGIYEKSLSAAGPLESYAFCKEAYALRDGFLTAYSFAQVLDSDSARLDYENDFSLVSNLPTRMTSLIKQAVVRIRPEGDWGSFVSTAAAQAFSDAGFPVQGGSGRYDAVIIVKDNERVSDFEGKEFFAVIPSISVELRSSGGKSLHTFSYKAEEKGTGWSLDAARKKAYPKCAGDFQLKLYESLDAQFGLKIF